MMPVVAGEASTRKQILVYCILLLPLSIAPWFVGGAGVFYAVSALILSGLFLALAVPVAVRRSSGEDDPMRPEKRLFGFSVLYLFAIFAALVADRWISVQGLA